MQGGPEGIELATAVAKNDPSADVQFAVIEALLFRRAEKPLSICWPRLLRRFGRCSRRRDMRTKSPIRPRASA